MPSLVVIGQQIKEKQRGGGGGSTMLPPVYIITKYPSLNMVKKGGTGRISKCYCFTTHFTSISSSSETTEGRVVEDQLEN